MSEVQEIVRAQIPAAEPTEERETEVYTAPGDMLIANVVYTPAGDIRGDWDRPRYMQLRVGRFDEPGGRYVADASAQTSAFCLPAGVPQNAELVWTNRLRVRGEKRCIGAPTSCAAILQMVSPTRGAQSRSCWSPRTWTTPAHRD